MRNIGKKISNSKNNLKLNIHQYKTYIYKIAHCAYIIIVALFGLFMITSLMYKIPILGSIATTYSGSLIQVWMIIAILLSGISVFKLKRLKNKTNVVNFIITTLSLIICIYILTRISVSLNTQVTSVKLIKTYYPENISKVTTKVIYYKDEQDNELPINLYYENSTNDKPVIIYIHGGGWILGSENDNEYTSKVFAKNGYVVASIGYQLSSDSVHLWDKTEKQILYGIKEVADYLKSTSTYMIGDSAGGNLALGISYKLNSKTYKFTDLPFKIRAVSVNYPVTNPSKFYNNQNLVSKELSKRMATSYVGGSPQEYPERYNEISPENFISENTPPTSIIVGENDTLVPPTSTYEFAQILQKKGIINQLIRVPFFSHAGDVHRNNLFNQAYINSTIEWFKKY